VNCLLTRDQCVPLPPERSHLEFVVDRWLGAFHTAREIGPLHLTIGKALLTRL
jgi:hypothetical protein